jgi:hypothetical protein
LLPTLRPLALAGLHLVTLALTVAPAHAGADTFTIGLEQAVSNGVPGPGAGNIERPGAVDVYELTITEPTSVYFAEVSGNCGIAWSCVAPSGATVFSNNPICVTNPGTKVLSEPGTYTISVTSTNNPGTYGFIVWELNPAQTFTIGLEQTVSNGVPSVGAGFIEEPGAIDQYELAVTAGQSVYVDEISGGCALSWRCIAPSGATVFGYQPICVTDPASFVLNESGTYVFEVSGLSGATGAYSFRIWSLELPQVFPVSIGDTVSNGVPGPGAGSLEEPGSIDRYQLIIDSPRTVFFDEISGNCSMTWTCVGPDGAPVFSPQPNCVTDPGTFFLLETGTYTIEVASGNSSAVGSYSFRLVEVATPQFFDITVGSFVSNGVPAAGAGNIESPGSVDIYRLEATAGEAICFLDGEGGCAIRWRLLDPNGGLVFSDIAICVNDPGTFVMPTTGTYEIIVFGVESSTGTYGIAVQPSRVADLDGDCHVTAADLAILLGAWGTCGDPCPADLNADGVIDAADLATLLGEWG